MTEKIETVARNMRLTDNVREYVEKKASKLERHLQEIDEIRVELSHIKSARSAQDRQVAQITVHGKGFLLRTEERGEEIHAAFDAALDKMQRQMERYKGKRSKSRNRGDGKTLGTVMAEEEDTEAQPEADMPVIVRRKKFALTPMDENEAIEHMQLLGHEAFFVFFNFNTDSVNVIYRRRDGTYGLIEPELG